MADPTLVQQLATFAVNVREHGLAPEVVADVHGRVLDTLGNALAASTLRDGDGVEPGDAVRSLIVRWGGEGHARAIGVAQALPAPSAALLNGTYAHALDFDDTHLPSVLHPSASVVPAALAAAQEVSADGRRLVEAIAVGDEICNRLGMASYQEQIRNSVFFEHGLHATSICGTVGGAAAAALLYGLDADGVTHAMAIACSMGAGLIEANRTGGSVKRIHCGWAAHAAVVAASMANAGITGPPTVLEGRFGFFEALSRSQYDPAAITDGLGWRWELLRTFYKPYPSNHFTHAGIDAAIALRTAHSLETVDITAIELGLPGPVMRSIAEPAEEKAHPRSGYHGKFSGPFTVATALIGGGGLGVYLDDFNDDCLGDTERMRLASIVRCVVDDEATASFPHQFPAVLRIRTKSGATLEHRVRVNRGGPQNPLSADELALKYTLNATRAVDGTTAQSIRDAVEHLDDATDTASLVPANVG